MTNLATLEGELAAEPERRTTSTGKTVTNARLVTREQSSSKTFAQYHTIVAWQDLGDELAQYRKGERVRIEGRITYRSWEDKNGSKRYVTEIVAREVHPVGDSSPPRAEETPLEDSDVPF